MLLLLIVSSINISLSSNKDVYLKGESILLSWDILNSENTVSYYAPHGSIWDFIEVLDKNGKEIPHIKGYGLTAKRKGAEGKRWKPKMKEINPGDTVKSRVIDLIGSWGTGTFTDRGIGVLYIEPGEYSIYIVYYGKSNSNIHDIYSDTINIQVIEPIGKQDEMWRMYNKFMEADIRADEEEQVNYAITMMKKDIRSEYINSILFNLKGIFRTYKRDELHEEVIKMKDEVRELIGFLKRNVTKFEGSAVKNAIWSIIKGELMLGTSKEQVKSQIKQLDVPLDREIKEFLEIDE